MKLILIILTLISQQIDVWEKERTFAAESLAKIAVDNCRNVSSRRHSEALLVAKQIISLEQRLGVPEEMWGIALSAACSESGYNPNAKGDRKFSKTGKPKAIGLYQMWPWWASKRSYGVDRRDVESSTRVWLTHVKKQIPKVKKRCKTRTVIKTWVVAWVHAVRSPRPGGRCREKPNHYAYFKKIRKIYETQKEYIADDLTKTRSKLTHQKDDILSAKCTASR